MFALPERLTSPTGNLSRNTNQVGSNHLPALYKITLSDPAKLSRGFKQIEFAGIVSCESDGGLRLRRKQRILKAPPDPIQDRRAVSGRLSVLSFHDSLADRVLLIRRLLRVRVRIGAPRIL